MNRINVLKGKKDFAIFEAYPFILTVPRFAIVFGIVPFAPK